MPKRIQLRRAKGWRIPPDAVVVGRPTRWGNIFKIDDARTAGHHGSDHHLRGFCVIRFRDWLNGEEHERWPQYEDTRAFILHNVHKLRGKDLACWCPIGEPCHADVLLELANS